MVEKIYIGVDGGGTKCKLRIEDSRGRLLGEACGGPANIRLSVENTWNSINYALTAALEQAQININDSDYAFYAGMALAGCEVKAAREAFLKHAKPFKKIVLESDAYAACLGAHAGHDGAIIIVGTGTIGMQMEAGKITRVAGWGFPHSDEGGGAWLGLEAVRFTLQWLDGRLASSPLLIAISQQVANDKAQFAAWANSANSTAFATIAPLVVEYSRQQDPYALHLLQQAGQYIDEIAATLNNQAANKNLPCSLLGGLAPFVEPWLSAELYARLQPRQFDATVGAVLMIKREVSDNL